MGCRGISNSWVTVDPVVGGELGAVVVPFRAIPHPWALVGLVGGVRPMLAEGDVRPGVGSANDGRGSAVRLLKTDHQADNDRHALLLIPGILCHLHPGHIQ